MADVTLSPSLCWFSLVGQLVLRVHYGHVKEPLLAPLSQKMQVFLNLGDTKKWDLNGKTPFSGNIGIALFYFLCLQLLY